MHCAYQRFWHSSVRLDKDELVVEATYCSTDQELCARMIVDPESFIVRQAWWEVYRAPGEDYPRITKIPGLEGMTAYFGCGKKLREALSPMQFPEAKDLFAEGVRGVVQSETFLWENRGYAGTKEYENYWYDLYDGACRYYSNTDRVTNKWYDHVGYTHRSGTLFNRMKSQFLYQRKKDALIVGHLHDSFHSVAIELELENGEGKIISAKGEILRAPDPVCAEAAVFMDTLKGVFPLEMGKKELAILLGGGNGCVHLIDLVFDGAKTFSLYREREKY